MAPPLTDAAGHPGPRGSETLPPPERAADGDPPRNAIYTGWVRHRRSVPRAHEFRYRLFMLHLDLADIDTVFAGRWLWSVGRRNLAEFRRSDYHGDPDVPLDQAVRDTVERRSGRRPSGPIRMLAHLRCFGHCFNPVVVYYGYGDDGRTLEWILAEISNIPWNERHAYLLPVAEADTHGATLAWKFRKEFTVSPFIPLERDYDWRFQPPGEQLRVHMDVRAGQHVEMDATLVLDRRPLTGPGLAWTLLHYPVMSARVVMAIYWQAFRLWAKGVPFRGHGRDTFTR